MLFTIQNFTQGDLHSTGGIQMSFLGVYNFTGGIQLSFLGVYNSTGGIQISFLGVYNSTGGIKLSFLGVYTQLPPCSDLVLSAYLLCLLPSPPSERTCKLLVHLSPQGVLVLQLLFRQGPVSLAWLTPATSGRMIYPYLSAQYPPVSSQSLSAGLGAADTAALFPQYHC